MKTKQSIYFFILFIGFLLTGCGTSNRPDSNDDDLFDKLKSGSSKNEVKIGDQVWMTTNLNTIKFRNGDSIPFAKTKEEWKTAANNGQPAFCYYENDPINKEKYGLLYNWYAVNDHRGLAPNGWHIPTDNEWETLISFLAGNYKAGTHLKSVEFDGFMVAVSEPANGNGNSHVGDTAWLCEDCNSSEFSALPSGSRIHAGDFGGLESDCYWWSATESSKNQAFSRNLTAGFPDVYKWESAKGAGFSIRCIKDK